MLIEQNSTLDIAEWRSRQGRLEGQVCRVEIGGRVVGTGFLGPEVVLTAFEVVRRFAAFEGVADYSHHCR